MQNYYWNKRNYTAVTLGKANSMTVVPNVFNRSAATLCFFVFLSHLLRSETLMLRLLVLVLVCLQTFQIYLGYMLVSH
jgi:hypothetical protein